MVPDEWDHRLIEALEQENVIRSLGTVITTSGERKLNIAATKPVASWVEECGELVFSDASFEQVILDAYKLSVAVKVSEELLADNQYDLEGFLIRSFGQAIANAEEEAFLTACSVTRCTPARSCLRWMRVSRSWLSAIFPATTSVTAEPVPWRLSASCMPVWGRSPLSPKSAWTVS